MNILFLLHFQKLKILKDNLRFHEKSRLLITYGSFRICLEFLIKSIGIESLNLSPVIRWSINNLNENGKIKIVQKIFARKLKPQFIRFDTFHLMP